MNGKLNHVYTNSYIPICLFIIYRIIYTNSFNCKKLCIGDWVYKLFMHQAYVFINQQQYNKSNELLTHILNEAY